MDDMEAKELMIGDWVNIKGCEIAQIRDLKDLLNVELGIFVASGVPLTEEILKANGWQKNDPHWVSTLRRYCYKDGSEWSLSFTLQKGIWDAYIHNGGDLNINKFHPMYVHELQRVLRCCGLWNLADNFKLN